MNLFQYFFRRILMMIPTLLGITLLTFVVINLAPGGPIEQKLQQIRMGGADGGRSGVGGVNASQEQGVSDEVLSALKKQYGFDKPLTTRYWIWLKNIARMDFGRSFTYEEPVIDVIIQRFPVSLQFGIVSFFLSYLVCIPLGLYMAIKEHQLFDTVASVSLIVAYSIPSFMLGILLLVFFAGGSFFDIFPIGYLRSDAYSELSFFDQIGDRIHHFILPLIAYMIGSFTTLTMLTKNSVLEEIRKDYIRTARAKGVEERLVYWKHALRNALIPVVTGIGGFLMIFFSGSLLIETIFQLDGIGLLGYTSVLARDYNVIMGLLFIQSVLMLVGNLIGDFAYILVDPRIDFS